MRSIGVCPSKNSHGGRVSCLVIVGGFLATQICTSKPEGMIGVKKLQNKVSEDETYRFAITGTIYMLEVSTAP